MKHWNHRTLTLVTGILLLFLTVGIVDAAEQIMLKLTNPNSDNNPPWSVCVGDAGGTNKAKLRATISGANANPSHAGYVVDAAGKFTVTWVVKDANINTVIANGTTSATSMTGHQFNFEVSTATAITYKLVVEATFTEKTKQTPSDTQGAGRNTYTRTSAEAVLSVQKVELKSISFVDAGAGNGGNNEHILYENSSTVGGWGAGAEISDPVWVCDGNDSNSDPDKNAPVCYTRNSTTDASKLKLAVVLRAQPSGLKFDLVGLDGTTEYFRKNGETSSGGDQTVTVVASQNLPGTVEKLAKTFTWKAIFTDSNPDVECPIQTTAHDIYVVFSSPITTLSRPEGGSEENKPTQKRLDFCIVEASTQGRGVVHGTAATSIVQPLQSYIAISIFGRKGFFQEYPTPSPIWKYVKTKMDGGVPKADCIQQSCMLAAGLGQLGIAAGGDHAYPSSDNDCTSEETHPTVENRVLRYVTHQNSEDTSNTGAAYLNNFHATAWVKDESNVKKYYTMWPLYPPKDTLLAVLQHERDALDTDTVEDSADTKYLQYWSWTIYGSPTPNPTRFVDETLHPKRAPANRPPVWNNPVPLP